MTSVGVVEDHPIFRAGLVQLLQDALDIELTAVCRSLEEFATVPAPLLKWCYWICTYPGSRAPRASAPSAAADRGCSSSPPHRPARRSSTPSWQGPSGYLLKTADGTDLLHALKVVAEDLGISVQTVHSYLDRIRDKIGKRRRVDLARWALDQGRDQPRHMETMTEGSGTAR